MEHEVEDRGAVVRSIDLPAGVAEVWRALTDAERVGDWFGAEVSWELAPGGALAVGPGDDGAPSRRGRVDEVLEAERLRFAWWPDQVTDRVGASVVTYELTPLAEGTRLVVTEVPAIAPSPTAHASASVGTAWDLRLVGLWLGCHTRLLVGV